MDEGCGIQPADEGRCGWDTDGVWVSRTPPLLLIPSSSDGTDDTTRSSNGNTTPVVGWMLIHLISDPVLFKAVRDEVVTTFVTAPATGKRLIDAQKMLALPLLQSIYTEGIRMHVSMNVTRGVLEDMTLGDYVLEKGSLLQASTEITQLDEEIWGVDGHPASEFWAERHIKYGDGPVGKDGKPKKVATFSTAGRTNDIFVYGNAPLSSFLLTTQPICLCLLTGHRRWCHDLSRQTLCETGDDADRGYDCGQL